MRDLETLRSAWATLPDSAPPPGCASPEEIWEAVSGRGSEERVRALLGHSVHCSECSALWRLGHDLAVAGGELPDDARPSAPLPLRRRTRMFLGVGALAAAAVLAFVLVPRPVGQQGPATIRGSGEGVLQPDPAAATLDRVRPVLRWSGAPEGSRYAVTVSATDLTVLFRKNGLLAPELALPPEVLTSLGPGAEVVWTVEATLPDGRRIGSPAFLSRLR